MKVEITPHVRELIRRRSTSGSIPSDTYEPLPNGNFLVDFTRPTIALLNSQAFEGESLNDTMERVLTRSLTGGVH